MEWKEIEEEDSFRVKVSKIVVKVINLLVEKNEQYGDSAFDPIRFFSKLGPDAGLRVRIDDKLSRLMRGSDTIESDIDVIEDLIGYFILLRLTMEGNTPTPKHPQQPYADWKKRSQYWESKQGKNGGNDDEMEPKSLR